MIRTKWSESAHPTVSPKNVAVGSPQRLDINGVRPMRPWPTAWPTNRCPSWRAADGRGCDGCDLQLDDRGVIEEAVKQNASGDVVAEHGAEIFDGSVAGEDGGVGFVTAAEDLE